MRIIEGLSRFLSTPTFSITDDEGAALDSGCQKAATSHPAHPRREVAIKQSSRHTHYGYVTT